MSNAMLLEEPLLEFGGSQNLADPHSGLSLFGPFDLKLPSHPTKLTYGVIATSNGLDSFKAFSKKIHGPIVSCKAAEIGKLKDQFLWPPFPGFEAAFGTEWEVSPVFEHVLDRDALEQAVKSADAYQRTYTLVDHFLKGIKEASEKDESVPIIICVVPDSIWEYCRPKSVVPNPIGNKPSASEIATRRKQLGLFGDYKPEQYSMSLDFRRQLKARAMCHGIPLQIIRESTLSLVEGADPTTRRGLTALSDRAWNISSVLYYKSGGKPWRLASAREGVCYVGIAFRRAEHENSLKTACCAAQMFLDDGDGVVFRGEFGPWYSPENKECHLSEEGAYQLLSGVIESYKSQGGKPLKEIFLHSRSLINSEEFKGYQRACPDGTKIVAIRVRQDSDGLRLYRQGNWPVIRGTFLKISDWRGYLWASGFKPNLNTYDGWEVPLPLQIDVQHGEADIVQVARDILGLTKLNYNACRLGDASPVTVGFSDLVGEILVSNPEVSSRKPSFKFYI